MNKKLVVIVALLVFLIPVGVAVADSVVEDDFEDGDVNGWSGTNVQVTSIDPIEGSFSAELTGGSSADTDFSLQQTNQPHQPTSNHKNIWRIE